MRKILLVLLAIGCGPSVEFRSHTLNEAPPGLTSSVGNQPSWTLTEGIAVAIDIVPNDAHVTFSADDNTVVRVQETSDRGTFVVIPTSAGTTKVHVHGDSSRIFDVSVKAQP